MGHRSFGILKCRWEDNTETDFEETECMFRLDSSDTEQRPIASLCEYSNRPSCSIRNGEFHYQMTDYQLLKEKCSMYVVHWLLKQ
jgi:hypothetical protein